MTIVILLIISYLIGAIPSALLISKIFFNLDIREHGSGNLGTFNVIRTIGVVPGIIVLILDVGKGIFPLAVAELIYNDNPDFFGNIQLVDMQILLGFCCTLGHIFPIYLKNLKGGKGVAVFYGLILYISFVPATFVLIIYVLIFSITQIGSISSILSTLMFPIMIMFDASGEVLSIKILSIILPIIILLTHSDNIKRIFERKEKKVSFKSKAKLHHRKK